MKSEREFVIFFAWDERALIDHESLFSNSKLAVRNVTAKSEILNILSNSRVFAAVEKRMVRSTQIGGDISPWRVNVRCRNLVFSVNAVFCHPKIFVVNEGKNRR